MADEKDKETAPHVYDDAGPEGPTFIVNGKKVDAFGKERETTENPKSDDEGKGGKRTGR